jgi:hypothetical protein
MSGRRSSSSEQDDEEEEVEEVHYRSIESKVGIIP